jgi:hypothetical protein
MPPRHPLRGRRASLATKHDKLRVIAPPLHASIGLIISETEVDTDALGTFSGEVPRSGSPMETAVRKARLGMESSGLTLGLASEGSIGPDPAFPLLISDREWMVLVDDEMGMTVFESASSFHVRAARAVFDPHEPPADWLDQAGFPDHGLIVRPEDRFDVGVSKGIRDPATLLKAMQAAAVHSPTGKAIVENDFRAHASPSRQQVIASAAERLARRLTSLCPACGAPGWGTVRPLTGLACSACGTWVTNAPRGVVLGCAACDHHAEIQDGAELASPAICPACNP